MKNKIALITGANKGIGFQIAKKLGKLGHTVIVASRNPDLGKTAVKQLLNENIDCHYLRLDVTDHKTINSAKSQIEKKFNKLDILINNAGIFLDMPKKTCEITSHEFQKTFEVNVFGVFLVTKAFMPLLEKSNDARIINMSSDLGSMYQAGDPLSKYDAFTGPSYRASKAALNMLTLSFARDLRNSNIKINAVSPGWCKTDLGTNAAPRTAVDGAETPVWLATQEDETFHGKFFFDKKIIEW